MRRDDRSVEIVSLCGGGLGYTSALISLGHAYTVTGEEGFQRISRWQEDMFMNKRPGGGLEIFTLILETKEVFGRLL